jgi:ribonuclease J
VVVGAGIQRIINEAPGRVIVATFASLIARMQQVLDAASHANRKVTVVGRSMVDNVAMSLELAYLKAPAGTLMQPQEILRLPDKEIVILTTGSQGEPSSALSRMANGDHKQIKIKAGDTVIISASPIPGNEELVNRIIDNLYKLGATVFHSGMSQVHVSGHAAQEEQKMMLALVKPKFFMPVHGEWRHMIIHGRTAESMGVPQENVFILENGDVLELDQNSASIIEERVPAGYVYVDGLVGGVGHVVLRDRKALAQEGIFVVVLAIDNQTGRVVGRPDIVSRGFVDMRESEDLLEAAKQVALDALEMAGGDRLMDWQRVHARVKDAVSNYLYEQTRRRPMVLPVALEV